MLVTEIVLLAMVALFVGLRLYSVLGRRTGHEQQPILRPAETGTAAEAAAPAADLAVERPETSGFVYEEPATPGSAPSSAPIRPSTSAASSRAPRPPTG